MNSKIDLKAMKEVYGKEIYDIILSNIFIFLPLNIFLILYHKSYLHLLQKDLHT